jgi:NADPH2:quinone reductase
LLHNVSKVQPGDTVLIHAIGGGVGLYLTQLAAMGGANVLGTVGTSGKEQRAHDYGASFVVNRDEKDFVEEILSFSGGKPIDKLYDSTGGSILDRSFALMRRLGHVVSYGEAEAKPFDNLWAQLVLRSLTFTRFHLGHVDFASEIWRHGVETVFGGVANGTIQVPIEQVFAFEDAAEMYRRLESRQVAGKLVLAVNPAL